MNNNVDFEIGEILIGDNNLPIDGNHYIVFYKKIDGIDFQGCMISTKPFHAINIKMDVTHFEVIDKETNENWEITYTNSYLVPAKLHKFNKMGAFHKVGQLTQDGIEFMDNIIAEKEIKPWEIYKYEVGQLISGK
jgi:hypothetical protein